MDKCKKVLSFATRKSRLVFPFADNKKIGLRTMTEIRNEKMALKAMRGDFEGAADNAEDILARIEMKRKPKWAGDYCLLGNFASPLHISQHKIIVYGSEIHINY